jgi:subtilisin
MAGMKKGRAISRRSVLGGLCFAGLLVGITSSSASGTKTTDGGALPGQYIVVLKEGVATPAQIAAKHGKVYGFEARFVYGNALRGYAATLPEAALRGIAARPEVAFVSVDAEIRAPTPPFPGEDIPVQRISFGVDRIDGDASSTRSGDGKGDVNVNVAVIDDGPIDADHPDLNVVGSTSCLGKSDPANPNEDIPGAHSTMVAGFIGARDNAFGRVGVAPGARIWAVEVFDNQGKGTDSTLICGLDWVTATRKDADPSNDIVVANLSGTGTMPASAPRGGCTGAQDARLVAVCGLVDAGVTLVAAAGNESTDFQGLYPATFDDVLAVTAIADFDGRPGGFASSAGSCIPPEFQHLENDDAAASFSNFATLSEDRAHTVAAPGVCIGSTYPGGKYAIGSGTSFATPLVAGTVALCIASGPCAGLTPRQIVQKIVSDSAASNNAKKNIGYGFQGDPLRPITGKYFGYLIRAASY